MAELEAKMAGKGRSAQQQPPPAHAAAQTQQQHLPVPLGQASGALLAAPTAGTPSSGNHSMPRAQAAVQGGRQQGDALAQMGAAMTHLAVQEHTSSAPQASAGG